jgi:hypothetical protein
MMDFRGCIRLLAKLQSRWTRQVSGFINETPATLRRFSIFVTRYSSMDETQVAGFPKHCARVSVQIFLHSPGQSQS